MNNYLSSSQLRSQLLQAGALIDETQPLSFYQVPRQHGDESNRHFLTKLMIFKTARDLEYYPFLEVPVHEGITDLLILPGPLYVQVEYCQSEIQLKSRQEKYYSLFSCKNYNAELIVVNYKEFPKKDQEIDHWHRILAPYLGLSKMSWYSWKKSQEGSA